MFGWVVCLRKYKEVQCDICRVLSFQAVEMCTWVSEVCSVSENAQEIRVVLGVHLSNPVKQKVDSSFKSSQANSWSCYKLQAALSLTVVGVHAGLCTVCMMNIRAPPPSNLCSNLSPWTDFDEILYWRLPLTWMSVDFLPLKSVMVTTVLERVNKFLLFYRNTRKCSRMLYNVMMCVY
jgi:hypothetical protein